jgi:hypothetical protein
MSKLLADICRAYIEGRIDTLSLITSTAIIVKKEHRNWHVTIQQSPFKLTIRE